MGDKFFPFDPRGARQTMLVGAAACAALAAWATYAALTGHERFGAIRAAVSVLLCAAFCFGWFRLRPKPQWGITLGPRGLHVARPFSGEAIELDWRSLASARRDAAAGGRLVLFDRQGGQLPIGAVMFPSRKAFNDLVDAVGEHLQPPRYDA
ncbi:MAG: hypothetical protein ACT4TC_22970 [Myxococcaceae bacterium]